jgi:hypothetical protein
MKTQPKYKEGDCVTIVHKIAGKQQATIVSVLPAGIYLVAWEGKMAPIHERYISEAE